MHAVDDSPKAILYAAKSTEDVYGSIPTQLEDGRGMAEREGWETAGEYADEAASAWSGDRGPQLTAAMEHAEREAPCVLLVQHSDRLARGDGRSARHLGEIYFWALKAGVELRSVQDDSTFTNPLLTFAMGERNAEDSRRKSLAVQAGMQRRREAGKHNGGQRPYGYDYADGALVIVKAEAAVVRRLFAEYIAGRSQLAITRSLTADGIPTVRGGTWHQGTVRGILANPIYVGVIGDVEGQHEAIIDAATWKKVEQLRAANARTGRGRPPKGQHLFRKGMPRCQCGESMVPRADPNRRQGPRETYYCYGRKQDPDTCSMAPVSRALIDTAVYGYFEKVGLDVEATRQQLVSARDSKLAEVRALLADAERAERKAAENFKRLRGHYRDGSMPRDEWVNEWEPELTGDLEAATAELERLREHENEVASWGELRDVEADTLRKLADLRRAIAGEVQNAQGIEAVRAALIRGCSSRSSCTAPSPLGSSYQLILQVRQRLGGQRAPT